MIRCGLFISIGCAILEDGSILKKYMELAQGLDFPGKKYYNNDRKYVKLRGQTLKAENLTFDELFSFSKGLVDLQGRRVLIQDLHALVQFRRDLIEMVGLKQARRILTRLGYFWGQADAAAMKRIFAWESAEEWLKSAPVLLMLQGAASSELVIHELDEKAGRCRLEFIWSGGGEAEAYVETAGLTDQPSCWKLTGYASGFASFCLGRDVFFIEKKCRTQGDDLCSAEGKDLDSWGNEIVPHLEYFQADDIQGKIRTLTEQLQNKEEELARQRKQLEKALQGPDIFPVEIRNQRFIHILKLAGRVAKFDSSLLVTGDTGVGKEVLARLIHSISPRSEGPFVPVNCLALPETLAESELFGHKAGAFTGANRDQPGLIEEAQKGTVFLDEIGDISLNIQMKLLRMLQEKEILRLGETQPRKVDVRVIAATNRDLERKVREGTFREDLFYRLRVIQIELPSLRERQEDILPLARHFVKRYSERFGLPGLRLDPSCLDYLMSYSWPGNIRELENAIEHAAVLCQDGVIYPEHLPPQVTGRNRSPASRETGSRRLAEVELDHIRQVLEETGGHRARAARLLGISEATLYRKLRLIKSGEGRS